jgi:hypothetical protein
MILERFSCMGNFAQNIAINMWDITKIFELLNACAARVSGCEI